MSTGTRKIYVVGNSVGYANWMEGELVDNIADADLVVFTGGEDVDPRMYKEPRHPRTYSTLARDMREHDEFVEAQRLGKHCIGICRGLQFMCVENNGRLVQHQNNPGTHPMETFDGETLMITSLHHQAAYPFNLPEGDYMVLGWTDNMLKFHEDGNEQEMNPIVECEIVYFPKSKCLGIQGHPEMMDKNSKTIKYLQNLLNKHLQDKISIHEPATTETEATAS